MILTFSEFWSVHRKDNDRPDEEIKMKYIRRIGKYYTGIIRKNIGIFMCTGLLLVAFGENGWMPNADINTIAGLIYYVVLPTMIAYEGGWKLGGTCGGILAVLASSGVLLPESGAGMFGAMLIGPLAGALWKQAEKLLEKTDFRLKMLTRNLSLAVCGGVLLLLMRALFLPILEGLAGVICQGVQLLVEQHMTFALSILLEPAKVFFLNNLMNHGILVPLGINQVQAQGSSILFLLETNPGPGLGILLALLVRNRKDRNEYVSAIIAQSLGGIHEVYFPFVLSDLRLLFPLILGGMAGNICFNYLDAGLQGAVSPGSVVVILLMAGKDGFFPVLFGMIVSAAVAFLGTLLIPGIGAQRETGHGEAKAAPEKNGPQEDAGSRKNVQKEELQKEKLQKEELQMQERKQIERLAFVCDGGLGSSVMGAALLRRILAQKGITGIKVEAFAADMLPQEVEVLVCQKDFYQMLPEELLAKEIYTVDSLVQPEGFAEILEQIEQRNG